ncbi:polyubiquitin-like [Thrips palmi]|uniref:Polyubiquitin-like n=1 Tax=Thrips palmi TaxID=161013 RepID=A0A6P8ZUL7_THRPL|nr:polyubiquitin-like [Thrips palmi]
MLAVPADATDDSLKAILERELGIPRAEQQLCGDWPSPVRPCAWYAQRGLFPATLHVCGEQRAGPTVWLQVRHGQGQTLVVAQSADKLQAVLDKVPGHIDHVHGLYRDGEELRLDRTLSDHGLACLHSLEMRERGCKQALIDVPAGSACPSTSVLVGFNPEDTVEELCERAAFKIGGAVLDQYRVNPNFSLFLRDEEVAGDRLVADCSQTGCGVWLSMRKRMPPRDLAIEIYVKTLTGKIITRNCWESYTIQMVKEAVQASEGIPPDQQRLIWSGREMNVEGCTLLDYGVGHQSTIHLVLRLRGGGCDTAVAQGALAADEDAAAPEGAEPVPAPPAQPQRAATRLAVGKILSGEIVPAPETVGCRFVVRWHSSVKLQFDVFVQEQKA